VGATDSLKHGNETIPINLLHAVDHGIAGQRKHRRTDEAYPQQTRKVMELEEQLRSQYQGQLDEKAARIEALTKKRDEPQQKVKELEAKPVE
jgi:exonuclease VII large subunit